MTADGTPVDWRLAAAEKTQQREREVQLLVNVIEPDPKMQPWFLSDESGLFDIGGYDDAEIARRLTSYFGRPVRSDLNAPLWKLVDLLKEEFPGWPDDPPLPPATLPISE